jgi:hypothetical protein
VRSGAAGERPVDVRDAEQGRGEKQSSGDLLEKANKSTVASPKLLKGLVGAAGFEPTTSTV